MKYIFEAKIELVRKGGRFISKHYEWAQICQEGKTRAISWSDLDLNKHSLPKNLLPNFCPITFVVYIAYWNFFPVCRHYNIRLMKVKQLLFHCYSSNIYVTVGTQKYSLNSCMCMFIYISNVFIGIFGLVSCVKLFKITADYLNMKIITYD